jgi:ABC-type glycerol-3-phosphate transport system permease component
VRGRLVAAGIIAFAVILGSCLAYLAVHPYHWTLDPVDLGVYRSGGPSIPILMAGSFISAEPAIVVYLIFRRYLVRGLTLGMGK